MGGRFFSVVFLASVLLIAMSHGSLMERYSKEILCAIVAYNIFSVSVPLKAQNDPPGNNDKSYYFAASNLIKARSDHKFPFSTFHVMTDEQYCKNLRELSPKVEFGGGGINGFCRGPKKALLDPQSITDPLFSRLSVELTPNYTVGHFMKTPPIGYLESVKAKENLILDPDLRIFYEKILLITQGKIFDSKRWKAIFELNFINPKFQKYSEEWKCSFEC